MVTIETEKIIIAHIDTICVFKGSTEKWEKNFLSPRLTYLFVFYSYKQNYNNETFIICVNTSANIFCSL